MSNNGRRREIPEQAGIRISVSEAIKQITRRKKWINAEKQLDSDYSRLSPRYSPLGAGISKRRRLYSLAENSHGVTYSFTVVVI